MPVLVPARSTCGEDGWSASAQTWLPLYMPVPVDIRSSVSPSPCCSTPRARWSPRIDVTSRTPFFALRGSSGGVRQSPSRQSIVKADMLRQVIECGRLDSRREEAVLGLQAVPTLRLDLLLTPCYFRDR